MDKISLDVNKLVIVVPIPITSLTFEILQTGMKEVRFEWSKASRSAKIIEEKGVIWGVRSTFQDTMKIWWSMEEIDFAVDMVMNKSSNDYRGYEEGNEVLIVGW